METAPTWFTKSWTPRPSKKGDGIKWGSKIDPRTHIRSMNGKGDNQNLWQKDDDIKWQKIGKPLDKNGNPTIRDSKRSHINPDDFKFK